LATGICGTDAHILKGDFPATMPVVLGHEIAGVIDAVGSRVKDLAEGDLVTVQPNTFCGVCRYCRTGSEHLCLELRAFGVHLNGGFSEALVVPVRVAYRVSRRMDARVACLAEPLACCIHGMDRLGMLSASNVLVLGAGLIGLMLTRLARLAGASTIVVSEPQETRRTRALEFGADRVVGAMPIEGAPTEEAFDAVIDAVGSASTFESAIANSARGGKILVFGVAASTANANIRPYDIYARELTVIGSFINPYTHERAVRLLPHMGLDKLHINTFSLLDYRQAFEAQSSGTSAKVEILPQA
jgi:2-desacetyl-2-hydroxyethyl bacteriochlorophyllide A dehydrogenase